MFQILFLSLKSIKISRPKVTKILRILFKKFFFTFYPDDNKNKERKESPSHLTFSNDLCLWLEGLVSDPKSSENPIVTVQLREMREIFDKKIFFSLLNVFGHLLKLRCQLFLTAASCPKKDFYKPPPQKKKNVQQTFVLHTQNSATLVLHTQKSVTKSRPKKVNKKGTKKS